MALDIGAMSTGNWSGCHAVGWDRNAPEFGDLAVGDQFQKHSYQFGIMVNAEGKRFVDEGEDIKSMTYAKFGKALLRQPFGIGLQIFDSQVFDYLEPRYSTAEPMEADTLEALADRIAERFAPLPLNKARFLKTAEEFNAAVQDGAFQPDVKDGKHTKGLDLEKTNWALRIDTPPFRCYGSCCGLTFTFGGVRVNTKAEVVDINGRRLVGLYATGEILGGFFSNNYPAGTGLVRSAVYGRIAGRNAAKYAKLNYPAAV